MQAPSPLPAALALLSLLMTACGDEAPAATPDSAPATTADVVDAQMSETTEKTDTSPVAAEPAPQLTAVGGSSAGGAVQATGAWLAETQRIRVEVAIAGFSDLFGIAGHLHYDPEVLHLELLQGYAVPLGVAKNTSDYTPRAVAKESPPGRILLGGARFSNVPSPFDTPAGVKVDREVWLVLEFSVLQRVATGITFDPDSLVVRSGAYADVATDWGSLTIGWTAGGQP